MLGILGKCSINASLKQLSIEIKFFRGVPYRIDQDNRREYRRETAVAHSKL